MKAIILAGGKGTRLQPYTTTFPKPLMPVGDLPILEILLRQLRSQGVSDVTLLTGHLAYLLESYFGDGSQLGLDIDYVREETPLGTAGPLRPLLSRVDDDFLLMNGDLLTDADYGALMQHHRSSGAAVTVGTHLESQRLDFGVLTITDSGDVVGYDEKPSLPIAVSMGLYAMAPRALAAILDGYDDMPNLIRRLLAAGERVSSWLHQGIWMDIGRADDYARANDVFIADRAAFLPPRE